MSVLQLREGVTREIKINLESGWRGTRRKGGKTKAFTVRWRFGLYWKESEDSRGIHIVALSWDEELSAGDQGGGLFQRELNLTTYLVQKARPLTSKIMLIYAKPKPDLQELCQKQTHLDQFRHKSWKIRCSSVVKLLTNFSLIDCIALASKVPPGMS